MTSTAAPYPRVVNPLYGDSDGSGSYGRSNGSGGVLSHRLVVCLTPESPNLHLSFIDSDIASVFNLCGPIRQCHTFIHPPRPSSPSGPSLPFAVVDFYSGPPAAEAVTSLNGTVLPNLGTVQIHRLLPEESVEEKVQRVYSLYLNSFNEAATNQVHSDGAAQLTIPPILSSVARSSVVGTTPLQGPSDSRNKQVQSASSTSGDTSTINAAEALKQLANLLQQVPPQQPQQSPQQTHAPPVTPQQSSNPQSSPYQPSAFPPRNCNAMYLARVEFVDLFGVEGFDVTSAVLGERDRNIHFILEQAEHKVSISLKGVPANDAPVAERLHMAITSSSKAHFDRAIDMAEDLLRAVCHKVISICTQRRLKISPNVGFIKHLYIGEQTPDGVGTNFRYQGNVRHMNPSSNPSKRLRV
eukprot:Gregarina_sp_Poly_1__2004@NODE_1525_length_3931_cov_227_070393_g1009_i0_p2_GENE_NODE_1525_length_3931_cov_227_070393_g1009_i0NODE_1525_length_3931_cov_227_070393_g1009_i0_p2_ORF_typecomplete_len411_score31_63RRM_1/PF00076_22/0_00047_NODE_1525_length_3931_cov_227_070393_g1009_i0251257